LGGRKEIILGVAEKPGAVDIGMKVSIEIVMAGHLMAFAAFLMQPDPGAPLLGIDIVNFHLKRGANAGKGVNHQGN
jgi:hypothetical protein